MSWNMFLDDLREVSYTRRFRDLLEYPVDSFVVARSYDEAVSLCKARGCPSVITFDHDLGLESDGSEKTGYDLAKWLVEMDLDAEGKFIPEDFYAHVHSSNPVGAANIIVHINHYLAFRKG